MDFEVTTGCIECIRLKEKYRNATLALSRHHDEYDSCGAGGVKDIAYIHRESELYEANNNARRAFNDHREKEHNGYVFA